MLNEEFVKRDYSEKTYEALRRYCKIRERFCKVKIALDNYLVNPTEDSVGELILKKMALDQLLR